MRELEKGKKQNNKKKEAMTWCTELSSSVPPATAELQQLVGLLPALGVGWAPLPWPVLPPHPAPISEAEEGQVHDS